jgi:phosphohistidine swiveling domain-containing protein
LTWLLRPEAIEAASPVGGKARALAELQQAELPIPPWFVVLPDAFTASLTSDQQTALRSAQDAETVRAIVASVSPSASVAAAIRQAAAEIAQMGEFAVRSSALGEDSAEYSFAGQLESFLFVQPDQLAEYVARVWRSGFGERLIAYRKEAGLPLLPQAPAVVIQAVIEGEVSGVAFSADPVSGRRGIAVVTAAPGLGGAVVSGETNTDTWRVDRTGRIVETNIASKQFAQRRDPHAPEGIATVALGGEEMTRPALDDALVLEVAELARKTASFFGRPQDIEWTFGGGRLFLLQSRPITGLASKVDPDGVRAIWDNSNIAESYSGITTPFTFSFARRAYEHVYRQFCRLMRVDEAAIEAKADMFCCMLGLVRGRVYYNLFNWYRLVAVLPGYAFNRKFMEQMMGVRESLAEETAETLDRPRTGERLWDGLRLLATIWGLLLAYFGIKRRVRRFYRRVADTLGATRPDLSGLRPDELVVYYRRIEQRLLLHWDAPIVNDFATMFFHGVLRRLVTAWVGDANGTLQNDLLSAERGMISTEPAERVRRMSEFAASSETLVELLCNGSIVAIRGEMRAHPEFAREFEAYLDRFGDRCMEELKLESPTLFDDPLPLLRSVGQYARNRLNRGMTAPADTEVTLRREAEATVSKALAGRPVKRAIFAWVLGAARARVRDRENLRFERTRVFGRARLIAVEIGKRLAALDCLDTPRDVFWLEVDEMLAFAEGRATTTDLKGLVALRKIEFERYRAETAPADRFETRGVVYVGHAFQPETPYAPPTGESLQGLGCCAGVVRGRVRVIRDPRQANVAGGEIIVTERTDPGWVMIFPAAAGLLVERGSLLSHSAIVAREMGLPTIVSLTGVTQWIKDGDWVEMDGASGRVTRLAEPPEEGASDAGA